MRSAWEQAEIFFSLLMSGHMPASHTSAKLPHKCYRPPSLVILTLMWNAEASVECRTSHICYVLQEFDSKWFSPLKWRSSLLVFVINWLYQCSVSIGSGWFKGAERSHPSATWGNSSEVKRWRWLSSSSSRKLPTAVSVNWEKSGWCSFVM